LLSGLADRGYKVNILAEETANWLQTSARQTVSNWIEKYGAEDFNAIVAQNDDMALGAVEALIEHKLVDDPAKPGSDTDGDGSCLIVPVLGIDATEKGLASLQAKELYGTVLQDAAGQAKTAFELVWQCSQRGNAIGYTTEDGISSAKNITNEAPVTKKEILPQCYLVPFVPKTK